MIHSCIAAGLREPELVQEEEFRVTLWRKRIVTDQVEEQDTPRVSPEAKRLILAMSGNKSRDELQDKMGLRDRENFRKLYIIEALQSELIEMTIPDKPTSKNQKYRLTAKGKALREILKKE